MQTDQTTHQMVRASSAQGTLIPNKRQRVDLLRNSATSPALLLRAVAQGLNLATSLIGRVEQLLEHHFFRSSSFATQ